MNKECPHCKEIIEYEKYQQFGAHITNCFLNPKRIEILDKIKEQLKRKKVYKLECLKCSKEYEIEITEHNFKKGEYRKNCSRQCANSKIWTEDDKLKKSISAKNSENVYKANKIRHSQELSYEEFYKNREENIKEFNEKGIKNDNEIKTIKEYEKILGKDYFKNKPEIKEEIKKVNLNKRNTEEYRKKLSDSTKEFYKSNPERHPNVRCANIKETYPEKYVRVWLENENIEFKKQYKIDNYFVDFYIPCLNLGIEVDGERWHDRNSEKEIKRENKIKEQIKLIRFWSKPLVKGGYKKDIRKIIKIYKILDE